VTRKPGRPAAVAAARLSAEVIIERGLRVAERLPVEDISIVRLARELRVTPALIHYYVHGGRDALTSGIMNAFYRQTIARWPAAVGDWRTDVPATARHLFAAFIRYPGVASYFVSRNRFRIFQLVERGETDYGALAIERFTGVVREAPLDDARACIYAHLLLEFLASSAHSTARHRWPSEHPEYIKRKVAALSRRGFPHLHATASSLLSLDAEKALEEGLRLFMHGLAERTPGKTARPAVRPQLKRMRSSPS